jgi:RecJ-like exonuclease
MASAPPAGSGDGTVQAGVNPGGKNPGDEVPPGSPDSGEAICPTCAGTGLNQGGRACGNCGGTGKITQLIGDA